MPFSQAVMKRRPDFFFITGRFFGPPFHHGRLKSESENSADAHKRSKNGMIALKVLIQSTFKVLLKLLLIDHCILLQNSALFAVIDLDIQVFQRRLANDQEAFEMSELLTKIVSKMIFMSEGSILITSFFL